jgi:anti-sigma B factor antagonist
MSRGLEVDVIQVASGATLAVGGDLDLATAPQLVEAAEKMFAAVSGAELTLDLAELRFCDSAGINALIRVRKMSDQHGWALTVVNPQPAVRRVLQLTGLSGHLNVR